jgi:cholesterol transport system auxiliary component
MPDRRIIASETFEQRVKARGRRFPDVIDAFDQALGTVLKNIVVFTLTTPAREGV